MATRLITWRDEAELVLAAKAGDVAAFERLVRRYREEVVRICCGVVRDPELAEDLAQETFLRVWLKLEAVAFPYAIGPWIRRIARNAAISRLRGERRRGPEAGFVSAEVLDSVPDTGGANRRESEQVTEEITAALDTLPAAERELLIGHFQEGLTKAEIAARLQVHPSTVGRRIGSALDRLRSQLAVRPQAQRAQRVVAILGVLATVAATPAAKAASPAAVVAPPVSKSMLASLLEGLALMGTTTKVFVSAGAVLLVAGGVFLATQPATPTSLPGAVAQQVASANTVGTQPHALGSESVFSLAAGDKMSLQVGTNQYDLRTIDVTRTANETSVQLSFGDGSTRVFRGGLSSGDFAMLGATNYVEDGSVEGTAENMPMGLMTYLAWKPEGSKVRFHVATKANDAFGRDMEALKQQVMSGSIGGTAAMNAGAELMRRHGMYPTGQVYRDNGKGFVP
ncbi:sigma-70 family RNA polymerase sigma factor [bacterium]|nr:sigma-70 family RNA polymerase sigma factor [bacterium]